MVLGNLGVAAKRVLSRCDRLEQVLATKAVGGPVGHVVTGIESDDLPGMADDGPLRRGAHADVVRQAPVHGLPEGCEVLAVRERRRRSSRTTRAAARRAAPQTERDDEDETSTSSASFVAQRVQRGSPRPEVEKCTSKEPPHAHGQDGLSAQGRRNP